MQLHPQYYYQQLPPQARGRAAAISVNWPQAVLQVRFVDAAQPVETESLEDI